MQNITIDKEFQELLPKLDEKTYNALKENILANGCIYPLIVWEGILIDGHNRFEICTRHGIPFSTVEKEFASREDVLIWIIGNQVARRNLTPMQLTYYRGVHYHTDKKKVGRGSVDGQAGNKLPQNGVIYPQRSTAARLAKHYKVSKNTITRNANAATAIDEIGKVSPEAKRMILSGDVSIEKQELERLSSAKEDEIKAISEDIVSGTYEKKKADSQMPPEGTSGSAKTIDGILAGLSPLDPADKTIGAFRKGYSALTGKAERNKLRNALCAYIALLEELYREL